MIIVGCLAELDNDPPKGKPRKKGFGWALLLFKIKLAQMDLEAHVDGSAIVPPSAHPAKALAGRQSRMEQRPDGSGKSPCQVSHPGGKS